MSNPIGLNQLISTADGQDLFCLFSMCYEFPTEWLCLNSRATLHVHHHPLLIGSLPLLRPGQDHYYSPVDVFQENQRDPLASVEPTSGDGPEWTFTIQPRESDIATLTDLFIVCRYTIR